MSRHNSFLVGSEFGRHTQLGTGWPQFHSKLRRDRVTAGRSLIVKRMVSATTWLSTASMRVVTCITSSATVSCRSILMVLASVNLSSAPAIRRAIYI